LDRRCELIFLYSCFLPKFILTECLLNQLFCLISFLWIWIHSILSPFHLFLGWYLLNLQWYFHCFKNLLLIQYFRIRVYCGSRLFHLHHFHLFFLIFYMIFSVSFKILFTNTYHFNDFLLFTLVMCFFFLRHLINYLFIFRHIIFCKYFSSLSYKLFSLILKFTFAINGKYFTNL